MTCVDLARCPNRVDVTTAHDTKRQYICGCRPGDTAEERGRVVIGADGGQKYSEIWRDRQFLVCTRCGSMVPTGQFIVPTDDDMLTYSDGRTVHDAWHREIDAELAKLTEPTPATHPDEVTP